MTTSCHRARSLVSTGFDEPLNDLEHQFVSSHLGRCGACRAFQEDAEAFTSLLRSTPLEPVPWPVSVTAPGHRSRLQLRTIAQFASVASVVVVAGAIALASELPGVPLRSSAIELGGVTSSGVGEDSIRTLRREALVQHDLPILPETGAPPPAGVRNGGAGSVSLLKPALPVDGG